MGTEERLLDVVIVAATGAREYLRACLESLERYPLKSGPMAVHVVDNASEDGSIELVRERFPWVELKVLDTNLGFSVANNRVLRHTGAPYALLLNPDTEVHAGTLQHMVALMEERPDVAVASCRLVLRDGSFDHAAKRSFPTPLAALAHFLRIGRWSRAPGSLQQYRHPELGEFDSGEVDAVNGAFMLVRRRAIEEVGMLDEGYWLYMEDLDWCYRFKQHGWKVWYDGSVSALHVKGATSVHARKRGRYRGVRHNVAFHRSMARFYRRFYSRGPLGLPIYIAIGGKLLVSIGRSAIARRSLR